MLVDHTPSSNILRTNDSGLEKTKFLSRQERLVARRSISSSSSNPSHSKENIIEKKVLLVDDNFQRTHNKQMLLVAS